MMQTFAYEIAAAFFLAAILMGGSFLRGFFSHEILRVFKLAAVGLVFSGAGLWLYSAWSAAPAPAPVQAVNPALDPAKQAQQKKRAEAVRDSDRKALARALAEEAAKPDTPVHIAPAGGDPLPDAPARKNRAQRIAKKVGQALRVVP
jgi:alpha-beta hydrolase superfamily lysophospholipase